MADIKKFVTRTSLVGSGLPKRSSLMQKIHADNITIKYMSRDGLVALIQKQRQQVKTRSALNEALLQNIKQAQSMTKSLSEKTSSLPELHHLKPKRSTSPRAAGSKALLRALSPDVNRRSLHGFHYRSNGDIRSPLLRPEEKKANKYKQDQHKDFHSLKQALLKATMIHCRDSKGEYTLGPVLNEVMKRESHVSKSVSDISENLEALRFMSKGYRSRQDFGIKPTSDPIFSSTTSFREKPIIGRRYYIRENDRFISNMMQQIYLLERSSMKQTYPTKQFQTEEHVEIPLKGAAEFVRSEPTLRSARNASSIITSEFPQITRAKSSFNIRYGVPPTILESRKPLLDECLQKEFIKTSQIEVEIKNYISDVQNFLAKQSHKSEPKRENLYGLWQTTSGAISDKTTASSVEAPKGDPIPGSA
ncbi:unnamed protein product [Candidula unifasciata]|uniref:Uncharacterized protein n=1 Tax=Candidula unifasciata TaxID=100452 RepID=A0A8S3ZRR6_9EUPU|nr:unnamed protein product [Candidula unifasciata]